MKELKVVAKNMPNMTCDAARMTPRYSVTSVGRVTRLMLGVSWGKSRMLLATVAWEHLVEQDLDGIEPEENARLGAGGDALVVEAFTEIPQTDLVEVVEAEGFGPFRHNLADIDLK